MLTPPENVPYYQYNQLVADVFCHSYGVLSAGRGYLIECLEELYNEKGEITFLDLLNYLREIEQREQSWKRRQYFDVVFNRVLTICLNLRSMFAENRLSFDDLLKNRISVILFENIGYSEANFLTSLMLARIYAERQANPHKREQAAILIDEAQRILHAQRYSEVNAELGEPITTTIFNELRSFGVGIILASQIPSEIDKAVLANCGIIIVGHLGHGDDISCIEKAANLSQEERSAISYLRKGYWIVKLSSEPHPFLMKSSDLDLYSSESIQIQQSEVEILKLSIEANKLLRSVGLNPMLELTNQYRKARLTPKRGKLAKDELIEKGYVGEERLSIGNCWRSYLVLTEKGFKELKEISRFWNEFFSSSESFAHLYYKELIAWLFKKAGYEVQTEAKIGEKQVDILVGDGERVAIEVELSPKHIEKEKFFEGISGLLIVAPNKSILKEVEKVNSIYKPYPIVFLALDELLNELKSKDFDLSVLLSRKEREIKTGKTDKTVSKNYNKLSELRENIVKDFYRFLAHDKQAYTELRLIDPNGRAKQFFVQSEEEFLKIVKQYNGKFNIYVGINQRKEKSGKKEAVDKVRTICIDIDSKRDKNQPASDYEIARAEEVADRIISDLTRKGFKQPIKVMSGNGFHLFFSIPAIEVNNFTRDFVEDRIKEFNKWISRQYTNEYVSIDNIGDLPRIVKVPGTKSIKGEATKERPYRYSYPCSKLERNEDEKLLDFIKSLGKPEKSALCKKANLTKFKEVLKKDEKLSKLYNGDWSGYPSRSEAEIALICKLILYGFSEAEIISIMDSCGIGKWQEAHEGYRTLTLKKAHQYVGGMRVED